MSVSMARCARCGAVIDTGEWYPVRTHDDADGLLQLYSFCSHDCRQEWNATD